VKMIGTGPQTRVKRLPPRPCIDPIGIDAIQLVAKMHAVGVRITERRVVEPQIGTVPGGSWRSGRLGYSVDPFEMERR